MLFPTSILPAVHTVLLFLSVLSQLSLPFTFSVMPNKECTFYFYENYFPGQTLLIQYLSYALQSNKTTAILPSLVRLLHHESNRRPFQAGQCSPERFRLGREDLRR